MQHLIIQKYQYPKELEEQVTELMKNRILLNKDSRDIVKKYC
jgi:hypothetical protein